MSRKTAQKEDAPFGVAADTGITPYATNVGSAVIEPIDVDGWKNEQVTTVKKQFEERFKELKEAYDKLVEDYNWNKIIYESEILFDPVMGKTYYLYQRENGSRFLSLISEEEWGDLSERKLNYIGSFKQDSRRKWKHQQMEVI